MSETVKLIIEIPQKEYEALKELIAINIGGRCSEKGIIRSCINAIKNGIPLDDVKAEIKRMDYHMIDCDVLVSQDEVLEILDNIGKENKE